MFANVHVMRLFCHLSFFTGQQMLLYPNFTVCGKFIYIYKAGYCFFVSFVTLNISTQDPIPVVSNNLLLMVYACSPRAPILYLCFQGFCYYLVLVFLEGSVKIPCFSSTAFKLWFLITSVLLTHIFCFWSHRIVHCTKIMVH